MPLEQVFDNLTSWKTIFLTKPDISGIKELDGKFMQNINTIQELRAKLSKAFMGYGCTGPYWGNKLATAENFIFGFIFLTKDVERFVNAINNILEELEAGVHIETLYSEKFYGKFEWSDEKRNVYGDLIQQQLCTISQSSDKGFVRMYFNFYKVVYDDKDYDDKDLAYAKKAFTYLIQNMIRQFSYLEHTEQSMRKVRTTESKNNIINFVCKLNNTCVDSYRSISEIRLLSPKWFYFTKENIMKLQELKDKASARQSMLIFNFFYNSPHFKPHFVDEIKPPEIDYNQYLNKLIESTRAFGRNVVGIYGIEDISESYYGSSTRTSLSPFTREYSFLRYGTDANREQKMYKLKLFYIRETYYGPEFIGFDYNMSYDQISNFRLIEDISTSFGYPLASEPYRIARIKDLITLFFAGAFEYVNESLFTRLSNYCQSGANTFAKFIQYSPIKDGVDVYQILGKTKEEVEDSHARPVSD